MRRIIALAFITAVTSPLSLPAQEAHVHGHGALDVAVEGSDISLMLRVPGADLLGFEGMAETAEELAAEQTARSALRDALILFGIPAAAACTITKSETSLDGGDHARDDHDGDHSDIIAQVALKCADVAAVGQLDLSAYFVAFPGSEHLDVRLITPGSATQQELSAASPLINILSR